ncbi:Csu type fimbrial protein [Acinetobacter bereziniae]|uniref:Csu type fimbrial protein n=1 Tax=Acinetobacter bereziniae TaxID=106648 RepID=UPI001250A2E8|nr:spore coat U domain-containing protein [Acinetobacter bereziniae]
MITLKKIIPVSLLCTGLMLITVHSYAECDVSTSGNVSIGTMPSITLAETGLQSTQFNAGLSCSGFLTILTVSYIKYRVDQMPVNYINSVNGERITVNYLDTANNPISLGSERELGGLSLIGLFSGPGGSLQFNARVNPGQAVSPGIYRAEKPFKVKWYYSVPYFGVGPAQLSFESPGFTRGFWPFVSFSWGSGRDATFDLQLEVLPDCRISTNDVNFGTVAFATAFEPVQTSMGVRCSAKTPYKVSLNNGLYPQSGNQRAMKSETTNNYLRYEIYKNATIQRWGSNGSEQWLSTNATTNAGNYDGKNPQGYAFTSKILENNLNNLPAGKYSDTITVQVEF